MCEYCGCQDIVAIAELTEEHDEIRTRSREAAHAARANDHTAAMVATRRLLDLLAPHTEIEERGLFPAMAGEFAEHTASLVHQHRTIESTLADLAGATSPSTDWVQRLDATLAELFHHILREQDGLFPASLSVMTPAQWDHLADVRTEVNSRRATSDDAVGEVPFATRS